METRIVIAQILCLIGTVITIGSFQCKNSKKLFLLQTIAMAFFSLHYFVLAIDNPAAYTGMILNIAGVIRSVFLFLGDKKWAHHWISLVGVTLLMLVCGIATWEGWISLLPVAATVISTPLMWSRNGKRLRLAQLCVISPCWMIYNLLVNAFIGAMTDGFNMVSVIISIRRFGLKGLDGTGAEEEPAENSAPAQNAVAAEHK